MLIGVLRPATWAVLCATLFMGVEVAEEVKEQFGFPSACEPPICFLDAVRRLMRTLLDASQDGRAVRVGGKAKRVSWRVDLGVWVDLVAVGKLDLRV